MPEKKFWKISPHIPVPDVIATVNWYKEKLGFSEEWYWGDPVTDGGCRRDELRVLFGKSMAPFDAPGEISFILFVTNLDAVYEEVQANGLAVFLPLKVHDYGGREFSIRDCNGYLLRFAESYTG